MSDLKEIRAVLTWPAARIPQNSRIAHIVVRIRDIVGIGGLPAQMNTEHCHSRNNLTALEPW